MYKNHFWIIAERGIYVATLSVSLVELCELIASHLF